MGLRTSTSQEIIGRLNKDIGAILSDAKMQARLLELGTTMLAGSTADLARFVAQETEKWGKVVKASGAKPE